MEMTTLQDLLLDELKDLYSAENQLIKAMPKMAKKATSRELKKAFETHFKETQGQAKRLEQVFKALGEKAKSKKCHAMEGLIEEAKEMMGEDMDDDVMDAALIAAAQKVEHYEIASYGTVRTYADLLGNKEAARLLQQTLDEEGKTDKLLTQIAESSINLEAARPN
jgi:ferritin-like metal-binding protein YciE